VKRPTLLLLANSSPHASLAAPPGPDITEISSSQRKPSPTPSSFDAFASRDAAWLAIRESQFHPVQARRRRARLGRRLSRSLVHRDHVSVFSAHRFQHVRARRRRACTGWNWLSRMASQAASRDAKAVERRRRGAWLRCELDIFCYVRAGGAASEACGLEFASNKQRRALHPIAMAQRITWDGDAKNRL